MIIGRFPGFGRADGADDFGPAQVGGVLGKGLLVTRRHTEDVVKEPWVENEKEEQRTPSPVTNIPVSSRPLYVRILWL